MRLAVPFLSLLAFLTACSSPQESASPESPGAETTAATPEPMPPEDVARTFFEGANANDEEAVLSVMTAKARAGMTSDDNMTMSDQGFESFEIGEAKIDGDEAEVPVDAVQDGTPQSVTMKMRREDNAWRIWGVHVSMGDGIAMTIDFEEFAEMLEGVATEMGEALAEGMEEAFSGLSQGDTGEDLDRKKAAFEALAPVGSQAYEAMWKNETDFKGQPKMDALAALADGIGLSIDTQPHADALEGTVQADVVGIPRTEAIERICNASGLFAVFPAPASDWGALGQMAESMANGLASMIETDPAADTPEDPAEPEPYAITLQPGERPYPVQFSGAFVISIDEVSTNAPNPTGSLTFSVNAYGLSAAVTNLLARDANATVIEEVAGPNGASLVDENVSYLSGGEVDGPMYRDTFALELFNVLRDVSHIATFSGVQRLRLPTQVESVQFDSLEPGQTQTAGGVTMELVRTDGTFTQFKLIGPDDRIDGLSAHFWATDAEDADLDIVMASTDSWQPGEANASVQTYNDHASLRVKLVWMSEPLVYPFELSDIPVPDHEQMPEAIEPLNFEGAESPLTAEFVSFIGDDGSQFREVSLSVTNHSNKAVNDAFATFVYLDGNGAELDDFPHTLSGEFGADGFQPLAAPSSTVEVETTAFNAPEGTAGIRVRVERVTFVDGTTWETAD